MGEAAGTITEQHALLRQLALGFGVHRLYPGDVDAAAFVAAAGRVRHAAEQALAAGGGLFELRSGRFLVDGMPVDDQVVSRLAQACYERRIEFLAVEQVPGREELSHWYSLLSRDPADIEEAGGMERLLTEAAVTSIRSAAGSPETSSGEELPDELLGLAEWTGAVSVEPTAEEVEGLVLRPGETAEELYERLQELSERITVDGSVSATFFRRAAWLVEELPVEEQARFGRLVIDNLEVDAFAERYAGHLNDLVLATLLVTIAAHGDESPQELARYVSRVAERHATLLRLVDAVERGRQDGVDEPSGVASTPAEPEPGMPERDPATAPQVAAAVAEGQWMLAERFPADAEDGRELALTAMVDLMRASPRQDHVTAILTNVVDHLRDGVRAGDRRAVIDLVQVLKRCRDVAPADVRAAIDRARRGALNAEVVASAAVERARQGTWLEVEDLAPFGAGAIGPVVEAIGGEVPDAVARHLVDVLPSLAASHRPTLYAEIARQRPDVVARLLPMVTEEDDAVALLSQLAVRSETSILRAVISAVEARRRAEAAPIVATVARRTTDGALQHRCLDLLAELGPPGREHLVALGSGDGHPRLPWAKRRAARRLARRIGGR